MNPTVRHVQPTQKGASLIEVLVAILILSFGMLSLGAMLGFAVQAPKMAAHRATATNLASAYIERMRANKAEFAKSGSIYLKNSTFDGTITKITADAKVACSYPDCTSTAIALADFDEFKVAIRDELPAGGLLVEQDDTDTTLTSGNLWILWTEPQTFASLNAGNSDNCPNMKLKTAATPSCLYVRFKL